MCINCTFLTKIYPPKLECVLHTGMCFLEDQIHKKRGKLSHTWLSLWHQYCMLWNPPAETVQCLCLLLTKARSHVDRIYRFHSDMKCHINHYSVLAGKSVLFSHHIHCFSGCIFTNISQMLRLLFFKLLYTNEGTNVLPVYRHTVEIHFHTSIIYIFSSFAIFFHIPSISLHA